MMYQVVEMSSSDDLEIEIEKHTKNGWKLQGGIAIYNDPKSSYAVYCQAMVYDKPKVRSTRH